MATKIVTKAMAFGVDFVCSWSSDSGATFEAADAGAADAIRRMYESQFDQGGPFGVFSGMTPKTGKAGLTDPVAHIVALGNVAEFVEDVDQEGDFFDVPDEAVF